MGEKLPERLRIIGGGPWFLPEPVIKLVHGNPLHPKSKELVKKFRLDRVIEKGNTEFEQILLLRDWVNRKMIKHGYSWKILKEKPADALEILDCVQNGVRFTCGWFTKVFVQCCEAVGFFTRRINVKIKEHDFPPERFQGATGHALSEVWSNEYHKWMIMDSTKNIHYEKEGIPLSAAELCIENNRDNGKMVEPKYGKHEAQYSVNPEDADKNGILPGSDKTPADVRRNREFYKRNHDIDYFGMAIVSNRTDLFENPQAANKTIWFGPEGIYPPVVVGNRPCYGTECWTDDLNIFDRNINETSINLKCKDAKKPYPPLTARFENNMPFFDHYEVKTDNDKDWKKGSGEIIWDLHEGKNKMTVCAVNIMGVRGPESTAEVLYRK